MAALQWHQKKRLKSSASRLLTQPYVQAQIKENIKGPRHWLCDGNSPWPVNALHKGPVMRKMFRFDDVIVAKNVYHSS